MRLILRIASRPRAPTLLRRNSGRELVCLGSRAGCSGALLTILPLAPCGVRHSRPYGRIADNCPSDPRPRSSTVRRAAPDSGMKGRLFAKLATRSCDERMMRDR